MKPTRPPVEIHVNPELCARCHALARGCCLMQPGSEDCMFGLTLSEITAIEKQTGLSRKDFVETDRPPADFYRTISLISPMFAGMMTPNLRYRLKVTDNHCVFLTPFGCRLPGDVRPCYCRLYPFWFDREGHLFLIADDRCLACSGAADTREVMKRLGTREPDLERVFRQLAGAVADHVRAMQSIRNKE